MTGMAVSLACRMVSLPPAQFNPISPPRSGCPGLRHKQRKHWENTHVKTITTPAVCSFKQQKSAVEERGIPLGTSWMSGVNESCHCFFFLKTKIGMPLCTVMVLVSHLAKAICILGAPGRCHSLLHLGWEVTWDPQQGGCCVKTHKARVPGGKTEQNLSLPCSPLPPCCVAVLAFPSLYLLFLKKS